MQPGVARVRSCGRVVNILSVYMYYKCVLSLAAYKACLQSCYSIVNSVNEGSRQLQRITMGRKQVAVVGAPNTIGIALENPIKKVHFV